MKIGFCGPQSSGKSTLLQACKAVYPEYKFVDEVTRHVKREYNVNINELGGDETQLYILSEHIKNHLSQEENLMLDRCILDGYVYTKYLVEEKKVSPDILKAFSKVFNVLFSKLDYVFYTDPRDVKLVDDGERSVNWKFRETIQDIFENLINHKMSSKNRKKVIILSGTVEERMNQIKTILKNEQH